MPGWAEEVLGLFKLCEIHAWANLHQVEYSILFEAMERISSTKPGPMLKPLTNNGAPQQLLSLAVVALEARGWVDGLAGEHKRLNIWAN